MGPNPCITAGATAVAGTFALAGATDEVDEACEPVAGEEVPLVAGVDSEVLAGDPVSPGVDAEPVDAEGDDADDDDPAPEPLPDEPRPAAEVSTRGRPGERGSLPVALADEPRPAAEVSTR
ncbi:hypothetical protein M2272_002828 [Mycobacterium frederiksbergense]|uniref:Uncharacterized protein n=1 Tax=Mycolicibacterium frederiksbergense TaxID=117567 RepID=A0ABT6KZS1_9MYCO|nr:hypothetical protein [Mycolicibacterium frederiksbergense]MDH6196185.1 hypothetical protein [Mycolicibacterium frederiksbergense]